MLVTFKDGSIYHPYSDGISIPGADKQVVKRVSTIECNQHRGGFEIRWHPEILLEYLSLLPEQEIYPTREKALAREQNLLRDIQMTGSAENVLDRLIDSSCSLDDYVAV